MIDIATLVTRLQTTTSYTIDYLKDNQPAMPELTKLPILLVGYTAVDSKDPTSPIESTFFNLNGEDLVQTFDIHIISDIATFSTIWKTYYKQLIGWNPLTIEENHTGFTYAQGGVIGLDNSRQRWVDRWRIGFPTTTIII